MHGGGGGGGNSELVSSPKKKAQKNRNENVSWPGQSPKEACILPKVTYAGANSPNCFVCCTTGWVLMRSGRHHKVITTKVIQNLLIFMSCRENSPPTYLQKSVCLPQVWRVARLQVRRDVPLRGQEVLQALRQLALVVAASEVLPAVLPGTLQERFVVHVTPYS